MKKLLVVLLVLFWAGIAFGGAIPFGDLSTWQVTHFEATPADVINVDNGTLMLQAGNYPLSEHGIFLISKDIWMCAGEELSGWSRFVTYDYPPYDYDSASVVIASSLGYEIPWEYSVLSAYDVGMSADMASADTGWERWSFTAPEDHLYSIMINAQGDDQMESWVYHRDLAIGCECQNVPEPATIILAGLGLVFIAGLKRRIK